MDEKFSFEFTVAELNVIIAGLRKIPYESSAPIITRINDEYTAEKKDRLEKAKHAAPKLVKEKKEEKK